MIKREAVLALGSNIGNRLAYLRSAAEELSNCGFKIIKKSGVWETKPWGVENQPSFLNMCLIAESELEPEEMLDAAKSIEKKLGRRKSLRWGPREIDIDIIMMGKNGEEIFTSDNLTVPHPLMHERDFVMTPLAEIAPDFIHPLIGRSVASIADELTSRNMNRITEL